VITIFLASLPGTLLGALMTLSTAPWYPRYATGSPAAALRDQQLAGVVMWAVGGMAYVAAGAAVFVIWLRELERRSPARVTLEPIR
jgi:cytochrome c oxidase assembly factor CtaG